MAKKPKAAPAKPTGFPRGSAMAQQAGTKSAGKGKPKGGK